MPVLSITTRRSRLDKSASSVETILSPPRMLILLFEESTVEPLDLDGWSLGATFRRDHGIDRQLPRFHVADQLETISQQSLHHLLLQELCLIAVEGARTVVDRAVDLGFDIELD